MHYYDSEIYNKNPQLLEYFTNAIKTNDKNISHGLLFWGSDIKCQCEVALEIARLLNCKQGGNINCECQNCRWIKEQTHPAVKIYTRLDFKESDTVDSEQELSSGKKNINVAQARAIISELLVSSDYHRVYIFCDRDDDGNLLPLNQINFPEVTSNALLKTFEEPPNNTTFIFLTNDKSDVISTVVSRVQSFFVPACIKKDTDYSLVSDLISNYWLKDRKEALSLSADMQELILIYNPRIVFSQILNYLCYELKVNYNNKDLFNRLLKDLKFVEEANKQVSLIPPMNTKTVCENLVYKMLLQ